MSFNFENIVFKTLSDWVSEVQNRNGFNFFPPMREGQNYPKPSNNQIVLGNEDTNAIISIINDAKFKQNHQSRLTIDDENDIIEKKYYTFRRLVINITTQGSESFNFALALSTSLDNREIIVDYFAKNGFANIIAGNLSRTLREINNNFETTCSFNLTLDYTLADISKIPILKEKPCIGEITNV